MKICSVCKQEKLESEFNKKSITKDGLDTKCRACQKAYDFARREQKAIYDKEYRKNNAEKIKQYFLEHEKRPERIRKKKISSETWRQNNAKYVREYSKYYRQTEAGKLSAQKANKARKELYHTNTVFRLNHSIGVSISNTIKNQSFDSRYIEWPIKVGYTAKQLKEHLEKQFTPPMSWENYGSYWEIDHIIPKYKFNFTSYDDKEFKICWSLMNLRPLTVEENRRRPQDGSDIPKEIVFNILNQKET